jgi:DNA-binding response OmpR family regulator
LYRMKVLIVEDDKGIIDFLSKGLRGEGYSVRTAEEGKSGVQIGWSEDLDAAIIDVVLPDMSGHDVLSRLREAKPELPVIMLSVIGETDAKLRAFDRGAVDYITKPFDFDELLARLRIHIARTHTQAGEVLKAGNLELSLPYREMRCGEKILRLTAREFSLLHYFFRNVGRVLTRAQILNHVWDYGFDPQSNIVDVYIRYLREKLAEIDCNVEIETERGMGYRLVERS